MPLSPYILLISVFLLNPVLVSASEYAGQESRPIKSLSQQDIDDIEQGRGWGLATPELLTEAQLAQYQVLRGYHSDDPCKNPTVGHGPDIWKRHNNCGQN